MGSAHGYTGWNNGFIIQRNIQNFEKQLTCEQDETKRGTLRDLIAEEKAKLARLRRS